MNKGPASENTYVIKIYQHQVEKVLWFLGMVHYQKFIGSIKNVTSSSVAPLGIETLPENNSSKMKVYIRLDLFDCIVQYSRVLIIQGPIIDGLTFSLLCNYSTGTGH
jgi:hypothetical protein